MGRELNPRCSSFDVKQVVFRSGMIAWMMVDWMYLAAQFKADQKVQPALALVVLFHTLYVVMTVKNEVSSISPLGHVTRFGLSAVMYAVVTRGSRADYFFGGEGLIGSGF